MKKLFALGFAALIAIAAGMAILHFAVPGECEEHEGCEAKEKEVTVEKRVIKVIGEDGKEYTYVMEGGASGWCGEAESGHGGCHSEKMEGCGHGSDTVTGCHVEVEVDTHGMCCCCCKMKCSSDTAACQDKADSSAGCCKKK